MSTFNFAITILILLPTVLAQGAVPWVLDAKHYHLGNLGLPEWEEFANSAPHGRQLELRFSASANAGENTLFIRQRNVKTTWTVTLNGRRIGALETLAQPLVRAIAVPPGLLKD